MAIVSYLGVGNPSPLISTNGAVGVAFFQELSFLLIIQELRKSGSEKAELFSKKLLIGIAAAVAYFVLLKILGFVLDSIWVVFVMMALLLNEPFKKAWPLMLAVSILAPVVLYAIFGMFLKVPLPNGILSGLLG